MGSIQELRGNRLTIVLDQCSFSRKLFGSTIILKLRKASKNESEKIGNLRQTSMMRFNEESTIDNLIQLSLRFFFS
jgi:hypothetical protein